MLLSFYTLFHLVTHGMLRTREMRALSRPCQCTQCAVCPVYSVPSVQCNQCAVYPVCSVPSVQYTRYAVSSVQCHTGPIIRYDTGPVPLVFPIGLCYSATRTRKKLRPTYDRTQRCLFFLPFWYNDDHWRNFSIYIKAQLITPSAAAHCPLGSTGLKSFIPHLTQFTESIICRRTV